jgi:hypothetical protein
MSYPPTQVSQKPLAPRTLPAQVSAVVPASAQAQLRFGSADVLNLHFDIPLLPIACVLGGITAYEFARRIVLDVLFPDNTSSK